MLVCVSRYVCTCCVCATCGDALYIYMHQVQGSLYHAFPLYCKVRRYRLDKDNQWRYKGSTIINEPHLIGKNRITVLELENNCQYRFSVIGTNMRGTGFESAQSTPIMVEASLPPGWFRFWDESLCKFFYSNIKTKTSSWARPELDPWFLDESGRQGGRIDCIMCINVSYVLCPVYAVY